MEESFALGSTSALRQSAPSALQRDRKKRRLEKTGRRRVEKRDEELHRQRRADRTLEAAGSAEWMEAPGLAM
ncbi:unnamed protein product [Caretta caretta]